MIGKRNRSAEIKASCRSAFGRTKRLRFVQQASPPEVDHITLITDYCGNIVYENDALKYILNPEGYAYQTGNGYHYDYYLRDHLGNNWKVGDQINNYYPSGMTNLYISFNSERQPYKFGGKELDEMHGLNWYDQGARPFDAIIPRTPTIDPLAEKYYNTSPYVQWGNNPINRIDPDGRVDIDANTQQQYPRLTEYLKNLLQEWNNKGETFKTAFKETSGLNDEQITAMLTFGQGPKLEVKNLDTSTSKINGETYLSDDGHGGVNNQNNGKGKIALDNDVVGMMENAQTSMDKETGHVMVESTTFHELTHVGNATTSHTGDGQFEESGRAFETKVYGQDIGRSNVATYVSSIRPKLIPIPALPILVVPNPHVIYSPIKF